MITNPAELAAQQRVTQAFIDADPESIVLTPRIQTRTTTGGFVFTEQAARAPQNFKVVERVSGARTNTRVVGGTQREEEFQLIGSWDSVIEAHDIFTLRGAEWEVTEVEWDNGYERRASVTRFGR